MSRKKQFQVKAFSIVAIILMIFSMVAPGLVSAKGNTDYVMYESEKVTGNKISNRLLKEFNEEDRVTFLIKFKEKADTDIMVKDMKKHGKRSKLSAHKAKLILRSSLVSELKSTAFQEQQNVLEYLEQEVSKGNAEEIHPFFIVNGVAVTATKQVAEKIAEFTEVEKILPNETRQLVKPSNNDRNSKEMNESETDLENVEWNVERVKAPQVWKKGINGFGIVIASIDSGVQWDHLALKEKYRGFDPRTGEVNHAFNWFDATAGETEPYDDNGHGTHTVGTMVGSEPDGSNQIGVAPGAKWIAVKAFTKDGGTDQDLLAAAEWILAPTDADGNMRVDLAPDIVNNSWGGGPGLDEWYRDVVKEWRNANIFPEFSAGNVDNDNPGGPESIASPANYPESFATSATDIADKVAGFSLRGPSPYNEVKPDISAPGQVIRSSIPGNKYFENSGTSMAGPAVSGVAALLRSVDANISVDDMEDILLSTAKPLIDKEYPETPNNGYGYGLVDALNAVSAVNEGVGTVEGKVISKEPLHAQISILGQERSVNTNPDDGTYSINYAAGKYTLSAEAYGYESEGRSVTIEKGKTIKEDFTLAEIPLVTINGMITDETTGEPVKDATLLLVEDANISPVKTDKNGRFDMTAYEGTYTLKITARDYHSKETEVIIDSDAANLDIQLDPFFSVQDEEIGYDDGSGEGGSWFLEAGNGWAVKMSLANGKDKAMVTGGKFLFSAQGGEQFQVEVLDANGPNGAPGKKIAGPIDATAIKNGEWTVVDLRDEGIIVNGDFYLVYIQSEDRENTPRLQQDKNGPFTERSWEMYSGYWYQLESNFLTGNKMIRALVDYEVDKPVITSPKQAEKTSESAITVKGNATPKTMIELMNNDTKAGTAKTDDNGKFSIPIELTKGENELIAVSTLDGKVTGKSDPITIILEVEQPNIIHLQPAEDQYAVAGDKVKISFTSNVRGGKANFRVNISTLSKSSDEGNMKEVLPGFYQAELTIPAGIHIQGALINVELTDKVGNKVTEEAEGKLFIYQEKLDRIAGDLRYDTAIEISKKGWANADTVVIARGEEFADALAGVPYAYQLDAPILLTPNSKLWEETLQEIKRLGAKNAIVIGGQNAINDSVLKELKKAGLDVKRIAGDDRFETAALIASKVAPKGTDKIAVANGMDFPDALSVASHAAKAGMPILLTQPGKLPKATTVAIKDLKAKETVIVGGPLVVEEKIVRQLPNAERLSGDDRYDTNIEVAKNFGVNSKKMYIATGKLYADALTGAVLAAKNDSAIILVHTKVPKETGKYLTDQQVKQLTIFGGLVAIERDVENALEKLIK